MPLNGSRAASAEIVSRLSPLTVRALPFGLFIAFLVVAPFLADAIPALDVRWVYPVKAVAVAAALALLWRRFDELKPLSLSAADAVLALVAGAAVFVAWINLDLPWLSISVGAGYDPRSGDGRINWLLALPRLAGAALVVPVMEELFWRSLVMRWLDRHDFLGMPPDTVSLRALLVSSVVFGLEHQLWFAGIVAGLVYGQLYRRSGKLWLPIAAHAVTNGLLGGWVLRSGHWQFW